jgi:hypothetical protein
MKPLNSPRPFLPLALVIALAFPIPEHTASAATREACLPLPAPSDCNGIPPAYQRPSDPCHATIWKQWPAFPSTLCSAIPTDVDKQTYDAHPSLAERNRTFDIFSWQTFLALSWPVDGKEPEKPLPSIKANGIPWMLTWKTTDEIFKPDGSAPCGWDSPSPERFLGALRKDAPQELLSTRRVLSIDKQVPYSLPLVDQNNNKVYYEIFLNRSIFNTLTQYQLYNRDGQKGYFACMNQTGNTPSVSFEWGNSSSPDAVAAVAVKLAWKVLGPNDVPERFLRREAYVQEGGKPVRKSFGLVGVNIARKVLKAKQNWVWMAFEHVDNVQVDELAQSPARPSFNDPGCATCPVNVPPDPKAQPLTPTQVLRVLPIPESTASLNRQVQELLKAHDSVLQYYELVGTQWPMPEGQTTRPDGTRSQKNDPNQGFLANAVVETYLQKGNQPREDLEGGTVGDDRLVFETSSCMGCHSSAPITVTDYQTMDGNRATVWAGPSSGDFLWTLSQRAQWLKKAK